MAADTPRFRKRVLTITSTGASTAARIGLGGVKYARLVGFRALATTDTATQIEIKDALNRVFYKDAADKDYATAAVNRVIVYDDTLTGLNFTPTDATGAALTAADAAHAGPVVESPFTVTWSNVSGAGLTLRLELILEV